jgi:glycosyltransferase involved in cell wall biosynthesis
MMNKYSIILPVRNGGEYFRQCVQSVLSQSNTNFNLHILDNCSTDGSLEWVRSLNESRIMAIESSRPLSIEESWGRIVGIEKSEFCTLIGHDDLLHRNYLSVMDALIEKFPGAALYQTHFNLVDSEGNEIRKCKPMAEKETAPQFLESLLRDKFDLFGTGYMMRSRDYDILGGIPAYPNLLFADFELWMKLTGISFKATAKEEGFSYRLHQSTTKSSPDIKMHRAFERFIHYLAGLKTNPEMNAVIQKHGPSFLKNYCKGLSHRLLRTSLEVREGLTVRSFLKRCRQYANLLFGPTDFDPGSGTSIQAAKFIDSNPITRNLFLRFKKIYSKPVLK